MLLTEITHKTTRKFILDNNIDLTPFENKQELRTFINANIMKIYRKKNAQYFNDYMRANYHTQKAKKLEKGSKYREDIPLVKL